MSEQNKSVVRRLAEEVIQGKNLALVDELFSPQYVAIDPSNPNRPGGLEGARGFIAMLHEGVSDLSYKIDHLLGDGDEVVYRWTLSGQHTGPFMGIPPTGRSLQFSGVDGFRVDGGKIVESWVVADVMTALIQLGVIPPPGGPSA